MAWQCPNSSALPLPSSAAAAATGSCRLWPWGVRCRAWLYTMPAAKRRCVRGVQAGWPANVHQNMNVHGHIWIVGIKSACKTGRLCLPTSALASAGRCAGTLGRAVAAAGGAGDCSGGHSQIRWRACGGERCPGVETTVQVASAQQGTFHKARLPLLSSGCRCCCHDDSTARLHTATS